MQALRAPCEGFAACHGYVGLGIGLGIVAPGKDRVKGGTSGERNEVSAEIHY